MTLADGLVIITCLAYGAGCVGSALPPVRRAWRWLVSVEPVRDRDDALPRARTVRR